MVYGQTGLNKLCKPRSDATKWPGPSCSKLTISLVNDSLNFTLSDKQICWNFLLKKCEAKATHIFSAKNIRILYIESAKTVNDMTLNELVKLTMLWTTGPWSEFIMFATHHQILDLSKGRSKMNLFTYRDKGQIWWERINTLTKLKKAELSSFLGQTS